MSKSDFCEIKSVRAEIIKEISEKMKPDEEIFKGSNLFKILGDYNRLRIINALKYGELCVCELSLLLDISQSSISHQLRNLRHNDIVKYRKENKRIFYSLNNFDIIEIIEKGYDYNE